jgi:hypothetical protein
LVKTDFKKNPFERLTKYANFTCRYSSPDGHVKYTKASMVKYPLEKGKDTKASHVMCKTPKWNLTDKPYEQVKLDIALNGQDYKGNFDFTFT